MGEARNRSRTRVKADRIYIYIYIVGMNAIGISLILRFFPLQLLTRFFRLMEIESILVEINLRMNNNRSILPLLGRFVGYFFE